MRFIERIEPDGEAETVCIQVAAADSLYVTDDFLVTHNTLNDSLHHPRRGAEHDARADEDDPHAAGLQLEDGRHRRHHADRPAAATRRSGLSSSSRHPRGRSRASSSCASAARTSSATASCSGSSRPTTSTPSVRRRSCGRPSAAALEPSRSLEVEVLGGADAPPPDGDRAAARARARVGRRRRRARRRRVRRAPSGSPSSTPSTAARTGRPTCCRSRSTGTSDRRRARASSATSSSARAHRDLREAIVHGALHLTGMDHETDDGEMLALQREMLAW